MLSLQDLHTIYSHLYHMDVLSHLREHQLRSVVVLCVCAFSAGGIILVQSEWVCDVTQPVTVVSFSAQCARRQGSRGMRPTTSSSSEYLLCWKDLWRKKKNFWPLMCKCLFVLISEHLWWYPQPVQGCVCVFISRCCCVAVLQPWQSGLLLVHPAVWLSLRQGAHVPGQVLVSHITSCFIFPTCGSVQSPMKCASFVCRRIFRGRNLEGRNHYLPSNEIRWSLSLCFRVFLTSLRYYHQLAEAVILV